MQDNRNRNLLLILIAAVVLILCCCCAVIGVGGALLALRRPVGTRTRRPSRWSPAW